MKVLAGDIGGTKTWLRIAEFDSAAPGGRVLQEQRYVSHDYAGLLPMLHDFLATSQAGNIDTACFGVAGPIAETGKQHVKVTNLPWEIDTCELKREIPVANASLINDFQAVAHGIETLHADDLVVLQAASPQAQGPRVIIGAGTGLGMAYMVWHGDHYRVLASEGGHSDFAPVDALQTELLKFLMPRCRDTSGGHVSYERVLSGPGLITIYEFLCAQSDAGIPVAELASQLQIDDPAAAISAAAATGVNTQAMLAIELFVSIYGAYAGNIALIFLARGGVYIAGGMAARLITQLTSGSFLRAFVGKGRMSDLLRHMPVHVVVNPQAGLMGAALVGSRSLP